MTLEEFAKVAPAGFAPTDRPAPDQTYKYFVTGKGCTLGVLFESSVYVCFEWLTEHGRPVEYPADIRYKAWTKKEFSRLLTSGFWEVTESHTGGVRLNA